MRRTAVVIVLVLMATLVWQGVSWLRRGRSPLDRSASDHQARGTGNAVGEASEGPKSLGGSQVRSKWAVLIGVDSYLDPYFDPLRYCGADVLALRDLLVRQAKFPEDQVIVLHDKQEDPVRRPLRKAILRVLEGILARVQPNDLILISFSGHGMHVGASSYLCPHDADPEQPEQTMLSVPKLYEMLDSDCKAAQKLVLIDACRNDPRSTKGVNETMSKSLAESLKRVPEGMLVLSSCKAQQVSYEDDGVKHGVFMHYVIEGLAGKADEQGPGLRGNGDGIVDIDELYNYAFTQTSRFVFDKYTKSQTPERYGVQRGPIDLVPAGLDPLKMLQKAVETARSADAFAEIAALQYRAGDAQTAARTLERAITIGIEISNSNAVKDLAECGYVNGARKALASCDGQAPNDKVVALTHIAQAQAAQGDRHAAEETLAEVEKVAESDQNTRGFSLWVLAKAWNKLGNTSRAKDLLKKAAARAKSPSDWEMIVLDEIECGFLSDASDHLKRLTDASTRLHIIVVLARAERRMGNRDASKQYVDELRSALVSSDAYPHNAITALVELGYGQEVLSIVAKAGHEANGGYGAVRNYSSLAVGAHRAGNDAIAKKMLDEAVRITFQGKAPNQSANVVCIAQAESGFVDDTMACLQRAFGSEGQRDPGMGGEWPEVVRCLAKADAHHQTLSAIEALKPYFDELLLHTQVARGLLEARGQLALKDYFHIYPSGMPWPWNRSPATPIEPTESPVEK